MFSLNYGRNGASNDAGQTAPNSSSSPESIENPAESNETLVAGGKGGRRAAGRQTPTARGKGAGTGGSSEREPGQGPRIRQARIVEGGQIEIEVVDPLTGVVTNMRLPEILESIRQLERDLGQRPQSTPDVISPHGDPSAYLTQASSALSRLEELGEMASQRAAPKGAIPGMGVSPAPGSRTFQGVADDLVESTGGNPTIQRGGRDLFRVRASGHGKSGASVTPQNVRRVAPDGRVFPGQKGLDAPLGPREVREIHKATTGHGTSSIRTHSDR